mgnify:CR=1 FL=1
MKYLRIMMLAAASCIAATTATAQEHVKAAIEKLVTAKDVAVKHPISIRQQDEADSSKLIGLCEVYNFQLTEQQKPLLDELEEAFKQDEKKVKTISGEFSTHGRIQQEYDISISNKMPFGKGEDNFVYLNSPSYTRAVYYVLVDFDRFIGEKDYHYTYALRWSDMNWEGKDEFPYRYMGKIVITYGTAFHTQVLSENLERIAALKAQQERRAKLMPPLISQKIGELQKKDTVSRQDFTVLYQYLKSYEDERLDPVDPDYLGICMMELNNLKNKKDLAFDALPYLNGSFSILQKIKSST